MRRYWLTGTLGLVGVLALLAAACAPAAEKPAAEAPKPAAEAPKPAAEKPAETKPAATQPAAPAKPKTSVSGIPVDPNAKRGGVLRASYNTEGPTNNPWEETIGTGFTVGQPVSNMLIQNRTWGNDEDYKNRAFFQFAPDLATSWEQSTDGSKWTFKLRDGVKWSDGVPFTCEDAKFSFDSIRTSKDMKRSPRGTHFRPIKDIQCADKLTLVINLNWAAPSMFDKIGMPYNMIFPKHRYEGAAGMEDLRVGKNPVGTGPFVVKEWLPQEKVVLVRKADYWDEPFPYLDGIEYIFLNPGNPAATALRAGRIDHGDYQGYQGSVAKTLVAECKTCKVYDKTVSSSFSDTMYVNHQRPPWNQKPVYEAIAYALDRKKFVELAMEGFALPPLGAGFYPGSYWAMPPERVKTIPGLDFDNPDANKQKARDILAAAGYKPGDLKMSLTVWSLIQKDIPVVSEDLEAVGIRVTAKPMDSAQFFTVMSSGDFEVGLHSFWIGGIDPDMTLYEHFYTGSDRNYGRYSNPEVDRLIDKQSATLDKEERRRIAWDAIEMAWRSGAKFNLSTTMYQPVVGGRMRGYMPAPNYIVGYGSPLRFQHVWLTE